jgi:hypothetical protein
LFGHHKLLIGFALIGFLVRSLNYKPMMLKKRSGSETHIRKEASNLLMVGLGFDLGYQVRAHALPLPLMMDIKAIYMPS